MATIKDFRTWLERDFSPKDVVLDDTAQSSNEYRVHLFTKTNCYTIVAKFYDNERRSYLGCIAVSRKPRAGEDWNRGNDLPDGKLTEKTWRRILAGIVRYELQSIHRQTTAVKTAKVA